MLVCPELFSNLLKSRNLNFNLREMENGDVVIDFPYQGKIFRCIFNGENGKYVSFYCQYEKIPDEKFADIVFVCNDLNTKYKWVTFYVDESKDLMIHDDAILSIENAADEVFELLVRMLRIGEEVKPSIMKAIYA